MLNVMSEFGMPPLKQEGMCSSYDHPYIMPWSGMEREFLKYFDNRYGSWYWKPIKGLLRRLAFHAWDTALLENAKANHA